MTPYHLLFKPILEEFPIELAGSIGNFGENDSIFNLNSKKGPLHHSFVMNLFLVNTFPNLC